MFKSPFSDLPKLIVNSTTGFSVSTRVECYKLQLKNKFNDIKRYIVKPTYDLTYTGASRL